MVEINAYKNTIHLHYLYKCTDNRAIAWCEAAAAKNITHPIGYSAGDRNASRVPGIYTFKAAHRWLMSGFIDMEPFVTITIHRVL